VVEVASESAMHILRNASRFDTNLINLLERLALSHRAKSLRLFSYVLEPGKLYFKLNWSYHSVGPK